MTMHEIPEIKCLECGALLNHASDNEEGTAPVPNDYTICIYCKHIMAFKKDLTLRDLTDEEYEEIKHDPAVAEAREFADLYIAFRTRH